MVHRQAEGEDEEESVMLHRQAGDEEEETPIQRQPEEEEEPVQASRTVRRSLQTTPQSVAAQPSPAVAARDEAGAAHSAVAPPSITASPHLFETPDADPVVASTFHDAPASDVPSDLPADSPATHPIRQQDAFAPAAAPYFPDNGPGEYDAPESSPNAAPSARERPQVVIDQIDVLIHEQAPQRPASRPRTDPDRALRARYLRRL